VESGNPADAPELAPLVRQAIARTQVIPDANPTIQSQFLQNDCAQKPHQNFRRMTSVNHTQPLFGWGLVFLNNQRGLS